MVHNTVNLQVPLLKSDHARVDSIGHAKNFIRNFNYGESLKYLLWQLHSSNLSSRSLNFKVLWNNYSCKQATSVWIFAFIPECSLKQTIYAAFRMQQNSTCTCSECGIMEVLWAFRGIYTILKMQLCVMLTKKATKTACTRDWGLLVHLGESACHKPRHRGSPSSLQRSAIPCWLTTFYA